MLLAIRIYTKGIQDAANKFSYTSRNKSFLILYNDKLGIFDDLLLIPFLKQQEGNL